MSQNEEEKEEQKIISLLQLSEILDLVSANVRSDFTTGKVIIKKGEEQYGVVKFSLLAVNNQTCTVVLEIDKLEEDC